METYFVNCPFCQHRLMHRRPRGKNIRHSEAIRLHERMIWHIRRKHQWGL